MKYICHAKDWRLQSDRMFSAMYRYGKPGCDAETCDYFLSYRRIGTDVEYEMSSDTDGWVAVGFSSDKKMVSSCTTTTESDLEPNLIHFYMLLQTKCTAHNL